MGRPVGRVQHIQRLGLRRSKEETNCDRPLTPLHNTRGEESSRQTTVRVVDQRFYTLVDIDNQTAPKCERRSAGASIMLERNYCNSLPVLRQCWSATTVIVRYDTRSANTSYM